MLKEKPLLGYEMSLVADLTAIICAFALTYCFDKFLLPVYLPAFFPYRNSSLLADYYLILLIAIPLCLVNLSRCNVYAPMRLKRYRDIARSVIKASSASIVILLAGQFLFMVPFRKVLFTIIFFMILTSLLVLLKISALSLLRYVRRCGYNFRVILIVGHGETGEQFCNLIEQHPDWGIRVYGIISSERDKVISSENSRIVGICEDIPEILGKAVVDEVVFIPHESRIDDNDAHYIEFCERIGVKAVIAEDFFNTRLAAPKFNRGRNMPYHKLDITPHGIGFFVVKRIIDIVVSSLGIILLSPFFLLIAVAIKATSKGPVFFKQTRCGLNGRWFKICKFRTMAKDSEKVLSELRKFNERTGPVFKMKNDPRVTSVGRVLRKTSLDELPQLINVLKGDMSLVGPRPPLPSEVEDYEIWQKRRLSVRPGISCIHEVTARDEKNFDKWIRLDLDYIDNWSFMLDLSIIAKSILAVFRGTGH
jgi:exopolysaccharide biosynthesis polyprenyl glycosylphosphotransferase